MRCIATATRCLILRAGAALLFALAAALITSVVFGLLPALQLSKQDLNDALKDGGKQQSAAAGKGAREALIVAEVAVSVVMEQRAPGVDAIMARHDTAAHEQVDGAVSVVIRGNDA